MENDEREVLWKDRVGQWRVSGQLQRALARDQGYPQRQLNYWTAQVDSPALLPVVVQTCRERCACAAPAADAHAAGRVADELRGRAAVQPGVKLQPGSFWLATQPVDMRSAKRAVTAFAQVLVDSVRAATNKKYCLQHFLLQGRMYS